MKRGIRGFFFFILYKNGVFGFQNYFVLWNTIVKRVYSGRILIIIIILLLLPLKIIQVNTVSVASIFLIYHRCMYAWLYPRKRSRQAANTHVSGCILYVDWTEGRGVQLFFIWSTIKNCWSTIRFEAEGFTDSEARSAERGRVGEGVTPSRRWWSGGSPPGNFWKIASKWCILVYFRAVIAFQNRKFIWKNLRLSTYKDFILDLDKICISVIYILCSMCIEVKCFLSNFFLPKPTLVTEFYFIILTIASFRISYIIWSFLNFRNISVHCILIFF